MRWEDYGTGKDDYSGELSMRTIIRKGIFETNSSSLHALCIAPSYPDKLPKEKTFSVDWYGWKEKRGDDTGDYLLTLIYLMYEDNDMARHEVLNKLIDKLKSWGVRVHITSKRIRDKYQNYGDIDHFEDWADFLPRLLEDDELLKRLLFGESYYITSNDNEDEAIQYYCEKVDAAS